MTGGSIVISRRKMTSGEHCARMKQYEVNDIVCSSSIMIRMMTEAGGRAMDFPAMHAAYWAGTCLEWVWEVLSQMRARRSGTIVNFSSIGGIRGAKCHIADYEETVGSMYLENVNDQQNQPGDPVRAGQTIVGVVHLDEIPKRLPLGSDAIHILETEYESRLSEMGTWKEHGVSSDFDE